MSAADDPSPSAGHEWAESRLWRELTTRTGAAAERCIEVVGPLVADAARIVEAAGTAPTDFTLHDAQHSHRVAERIASLLGEALGEISPYDLAFSLMAAYVHDIGMTPEQGLVNGVHDWLLTGEPGSLDDPERDQLQRWLDETEGGLTLPLLDTVPGPLALQRARHLTAAFARHRHNDWSEAWLRHYASTKNVRLYAGWIEHLVTICRSHHEGYDVLRTERFNPQLVGPPSAYLHLRHCACLLRIGDVLEFDPERTPAIVFEHREIAASSEIFWQKDHDIALEQEGSAFILAARPENAYVHRAIADTVEQIDTELALCRRLADETHFSVAPNRSAPLPNRWPFESRLRSTVQPANDAYEYIDGTFRPDVQRLLELLAGLELYGTPWAALREVLQNALDAVRERIARERLRRQDPNDPTTLAMLRAENFVEIAIEADQAGDLWLICRDSGSGMDKDRIVNQLLVSGRAKRHADLQLERDCIAHGFTVGRTARFGIGVLSYFLLASRMVLVTLSDDPGATGWRFETAGPQSFGELRRTDRQQVGTEVRLRLKPEEVGREHADVATEVADHLRSLLERVPCVVRFQPGIEGVDPFQIAPGWVAREDPDELFGEFLSPTRADIPEAGLSPMEGRPQELAELVTWRTEEGDLGDGLGAYRITIPVFGVEGGPTLTCPAELWRHEAPRADFVDPSGEVALSWNGINVELEEESRTTVRPGRTGGSGGMRRRELGQEAEPDNPEPFIEEELSRFSQLRATSPTSPQETELEEASLPPRAFIARGAIVQIDWTSDAAGRIGVDRLRMTLSKDGHNALGQVHDRARALQRTFAEHESGPRYALLDRVRTGAEVGTPELWWTTRRGGTGVWEPVQPPLTMRNHDVDSDLDVSADMPATWRGAPVRTLRAPVIFGSKRPMWPFPPDALGAVCLPEAVAGVAPVWHEDPLRQRRTRADRPLCTFPPEWQHVVWITIPDTHRSDVLLNAGHPLVDALRGDVWRTVRDVQNGKGPQQPDDDLDRRAVAAAMLLLLVLPNSRTSWSAALDRDRGFATRLLSTALGNGTDAALVAIDLHPRLAPVRLFDLNGERRAPISLLPMPGPDWRVAAEAI